MSKQLVTLAPSLTSRGTASALTSNCSISSTRSSSWPVRRAATITVAPSRVRDKAKCRPRPLDAPVTRTVRPSRRNMLVILSAMLLVVPSDAFENAPGDAPPVNFRGAIVDAEGAHIGKDPGDGSFPANALASKDLNAAINNAPAGFPSNHLGDAGLMQSQAAFGAHPRGLPDHAARR